MNELSGRLNHFLLIFLSSIFFFKLFLDYFYLRLERFRYRYWYTFGLKWLQVSLCLVCLLAIIAYIGMICLTSLPKRKRLDLQFFYSFLLYADKSLYHFSFLEWPIYVRNRIWTNATVFRPLWRFCVRALPKWPVMSTRNDSNLAYFEAYNFIDSKIN